MEILSRTSSKPQLRHVDRLFLGLMQDLYDGWKNTLLIVKPDTVIRWHQHSFKLYWRSKSRHKSGRPKIPQAQFNLIRQMANEIPLWGAPRIHGELLKLGIDPSEATILRNMPKKPRRTTGQQWKTFLQNHSAEIISLDLFRCRRSPFDYCTYWFFFHTTEERSFTSM